MIPRKKLKIVEKCDQSANLQRDIGGPLDAIETNESSKLLVLRSSYKAKTKQKQNQQIPNNQQIKTVRHFVK